jgi:DNA-binding NarL/FixJ family response regulator
VARSGDAKPHDDRDYVAAAARRYELTPRMKRLARLLFEGASIEGAADRLGRGLGTIKACGHEIYMRMDVHSRAEFVKKVYEAWIEEELANRATDSFE